MGRQISSQQWCFNAISGLSRIKYFNCKITLCFPFFSPTNTTISKIFSFPNILDQFAYGVRTRIHGTPYWKIGCFWTIALFNRRIICLATMYEWDKLRVELLSSLQNHNNLSLADIQAIKMKNEQIHESRFSTCRVHAYCCLEEFASQWRTEWESFYEETPPLLSVTVPHFTQYFMKLQQEAVHELKDVLNCSFQKCCFQDLFFNTTIMSKGHPYVSYTPKFEVQISSF